MLFTFIVTLSNRNMKTVDANLPWLTMNTGIPGIDSMEPLADKITLSRS